ncbi:MAG: DUF4124 domain-containing protein [Betaproteobacteria bacterium]|nr:DUF4124 domain-containing protein [Betaproteobacteria bacterium]
MKWKLRITHLALAVGFSALACQASAQIMKCVDDKGVTHYGNPLPPQCAKSEIKELSGQGTIKKTMDRPLTPEEIKAREEEFIRTKDERRKQEDIERRDRALVATYGAEKEFDVSRDKALDVIGARQKTAETRLKELEEAMKKFNAEMEFYKDGKSKSSKGKDPPPALIQDTQRTKKDIENTKESIQRMEEEKKNIHAQFEADKQRWRDLKSGKVVLKLKDQVVKSTRKAGEIGKAVCNNVEHLCYVGNIYYCREIDGNGRLRARYVDCQ